MEKIEGNRRKGGYILFSYGPKKTENLPCLFGPESMKILAELYGSESEFKLSELFRKPGGIVEGDYAKIILSAAAVMDASKLEMINQEIEKIEQQVFPYLTKKEIKHFAGILVSLSGILDTCRIEIQN